MARSCSQVNAGGRDGPLLVNVMVSVCVCFVGIFLSAIFAFQQGSFIQLGIVRECVTKSFPHTHTHTQCRC